MSKITTTVCVAEIERLFPASPVATLTSQRLVWKRRSKTGRKDEPVIRVFGAKGAPFLRAVVTEKDGALTVEFKRLRRDCLAMVGRPVRWSGGGGVAPPQAAVTGSPPQRQDQGQAGGARAAPRRPAAAPQEARKQAAALAAEAPAPEAGRGGAGPAAQRHAAGRKAPSLNQRIR